MEELLWPITYWHWLAFGFVILTIEVSIGTFDLLWVGLAALLTAAFDAFAPASMTAVEYQLMVFTISAAILIIIGRTMFSGMRNQATDSPKLNQRMASMIGKRGVTASSFESGAGRVKIGDTEWMGESHDGGDIDAGTTVIVEDVDTTKVIVRAV